MTPEEQAILRELDGLAALRELDQLEAERATPGDGRPFSREFLDRPITEAEARAQQYGDPAHLREVARYGIPMATTGAGMAVGAASPVPGGAAIGGGVGNMVGEAIVRGIEGEGIVPTPGQAAEDFAWGAGPAAIGPTVRAGARALTGVPNIRKLRNETSAHLPKGGQIGLLASRARAGKPLTEYEDTQLLSAIVKQIRAEVGDIVKGRIAARMTAGEGIGAGLIAGGASAYAEIANPFVIAGLTYAALHYGPQVARMLAKSGPVVDLLIDGSIRKLPLIDLGLALAAQSGSRTNEDEREALMGLSRAIMQAPGEVFGIPEAEGAPMPAAAVQEAGRRLQAPFQLGPIISPVEDRGPPGRDRLHPDRIEEDRQPVIAGPTTVEEAEQMTIRDLRRLTPQQLRDLEDLLRESGEYPDPREE